MPYNEHTVTTCSYQPIQIEREEWRDVMGYEGLYKISSFGRVLSLGLGNSGRRGERILKPATVRRGYKTVRLYKEKQKEDWLVHRLVAHAFLGESPLQTNHKNGIKSDNSIINLEYMTAEENMRHRRDVLGIKQKAPIIAPERRARGERHGSKTKLENWHRGSGCKQSRLTENSVLRVRQLYAKGGYSQYKLAAMFGVNQRTIWAVINKLTWKHV